MDSFPILFSSLSVKGMELKNRIVMEPMIVRYADYDGSVTPRMMDYLEKRAEGGAGLILTAGAYIVPEAKYRPNQLGVYSDDLLPGLKELARVLHNHKAKAGVQMIHSGRRLSESVYGSEPVAPSPVAHAGAFMGAHGKAMITPRKLSIRDIKDLVEAYGVAAQRIKKAGFDMVEIHGAHSYLINQFLSPHTNKRMDAYGGSLEGRMRFALEILERVRSEIGESFPVSFRMNGDDYFGPTGIQLEEAKKQAPYFVEAGADILNVSAGSSILEATNWNIPPMRFPRGVHLRLSAGVKEVVDVPVIGVGRINDPSIAEQALSEGKLDLVGMARALLADPELPKKAQEGRIKDIRKCVACNQCLDLDTSRFAACTCAINPELGRERIFRIRKVKTPKNVMVIGGGPAGMTAALYAQLRGHKVTLYEREKELGGQMVLGVKPPHKDEMQEFLDWQIRQLETSGVTIVLGKEVTTDFVESQSPEVVIVATGAVPVTLSIPGIDSEGVYGFQNVLDGATTPAGAVVVIGGGRVGAETAEFIAERGGKVTLIEQLPVICPDMGASSRYAMCEALKDLGVVMLPNSKAIKIVKEGVIIADSSGERLLKADAVVPAVGFHPERKILEELIEADFYKVRAVGDCIEPKSILRAVHEGAHTALQI
jgi:2,4-dienoyl-CoA reductase-like NADH-dependent reductase (Old Yellow Enzyme family)/thioredoxin reductase